MIRLALCLALAAQLCACASLPPLTVEEKTKLRGIAIDAAAIAIKLAASAAVARE